MIHLLTTASPHVAECTGISLRTRPRPRESRMYKGTAEAAQMWRSIGIYRKQVEVAQDASWRDRFLALTGRQP